jgi:hypothetical protein
MPHAVGSPVYHLEMVTAGDPGTIDGSTISIKATKGFGVSTSGMVATTALGLAVSDRWSGWFGSWLSGHGRRAP